MKLKINKITILNGNYAGCEAGVVCRSGLEGGAGRGGRRMVSISPPPVKCGHSLPTAPECFCAVCSYPAYPRQCCTYNVPTYAEPSFHSGHWPGHNQDLKYRQNKQNCIPLL